MREIGITLTLIVQQRLTDMIRKKIGRQDARVALDASQEDFPQVCSRRTNALVVLPQEEIDEEHLQLEESA